MQGGKPQVQIGSTSKQTTMDVAPEVFVLRKLLPQTADYDFNIHIMDFRPGEYLYVKVRWLSFTISAHKTSSSFHILIPAHHCRGVGIALATCCVTLTFTSTAGDTLQPAWLAAAARTRNIPPGKQMVILYCIVQHHGANPCHYGSL